MTNPETDVLQATVAALRALRDLVDALPRCPRLTAGARCTAPSTVTGLVGDVVLMDACDLHANELTDLRDLPVAEVIRALAAAPPPDPDAVEGAVLDARRALANARANAERHRLDAYWRTSPVFTDFELDALQVARDALTESVRAMPEITDEDRAHLEEHLQALRARLKIRGPRPKEARLEIDVVRRQARASQERTREVVLCLTEIAHEAGIPLPTSLAGFARDVVDTLKGPHVRLWPADGSMRRALGRLAEHLDVDACEVAYDAPNHQWHVRAFGGASTAQRVLDALARSWEDTPEASVWATADAAGMSRET